MHIIALLPCGRLLNGILGIVRILEVRHPGTCEIQLFAPLPLYFYQYIGMRFYKGFCHCWIKYEAKSILGSIHGLSGTY
jgi:hypothetical protein